MKIGSGWDLHKLVKGRALILGGVTIPSIVGEDGHSDGDVLIHAIIDALLGAIANGDIGSHFPDNNPEYAGICSMELLKQTLPLLGNHSLINLDCTVILDEPKLRPYIDKIRESIAEALSVSVSLVSVKAKTTEKTATDVIVAQAMVLLT